MKFIKKHKYTFIVMGVFVILFIFAYIGFKKLLYPDSDKDKYGDRLEGIEDHPIKDDEMKKTMEDVLKKEKVNEITYSVEGRIIKFDIDVKKGTDDETIELLGEIILLNLSDNIKDYYDMQIIVTCKEDSEFVPHIASKHKTRKVFVW